MVQETTEVTDYEVEAEAGGMVAREVNQSLVCCAKRTALSLSKVGDLEV